MARNTQPQGSEQGSLWAISGGPFPTFLEQGKVGVLALKFSSTETTVSLPIWVGRRLDVPSE